MAPSWMRISACCATVVAGVSRPNASTVATMNITDLRMVDVPIIAEVQNSTPLSSATCRRRLLLFHEHPTRSKNRKRGNSHDSRGRDQNRITYFLAEQEG